MVQLWLSLLIGLMLVPQDSLADATVRFRCAEFFSLAGWAYSKPLEATQTMPFFRPRWVNDAGKVVVYRGDLRGQHARGIYSRALRAKKFLDIEDAVKIINSGDRDAINQLIANHKDPKTASPLVATSMSPVIAQAYARQYRRRGVEEGKGTVYRIEVDPSRTIIDPDSMAAGGLTAEVFIIGRIDRHEITAIKTDNAVWESELLSQNPLHKLEVPHIEETFTEKPQSYPEPQFPNRFYQRPRNLMVY